LNLPVDRTDYLQQHELEPTKQTKHFRNKNLNKTKQTRSIEISSSLLFHPLCICVSVQSFAIHTHQNNPDVVCEQIDDKDHPHLDFELCRALELAKYLYYNEKQECENKM
jgi:hypothetical protein